MVDFTNDAAWNCVQEDNDNSLAAREKKDDEYLQQCKAWEEQELRNYSESMKANYEEADLEIRRLTENLQTLAKHITGQNQKVPEQNRAIALAFEVLGSEYIK